MLNVLRQKGVSKKVLWFITIIIVLSFGLFGVARRWDYHLNSAGTIYGQSVSLRNFERAYRDSRDQALILYGDQYAKVGNISAPWLGAIFAPSQVSSEFGAQVEAVRPGSPAEAVGMGWKLEERPNGTAGRGDGCLRLRAASRADG